MFIVLLGALLSADASVTQSDAVDKNVIVYYEKGRFGGWPANHGIWSWGNEILVGFSRGYYKNLGPKQHNIDRNKPEEHLLARSMDGGETWSIENPAEKGSLIPQGNSLHGTELPGITIKPAIDCPGGIDFTHPDFAMTMRMSSKDAGESRFYCSYDRGHTWEGPFKLPDFDTRGTAARTDYIVHSKDECTLFITAAKKNGFEGRPLCVRTSDGGRTWDFVSWIGPEPEGYSIMPASVQLAPNSFLVAIRCKEGAASWISTYRSTDNRASWSQVNDRIADTGSGNPPSLLKLVDGRLSLVYGYRDKPFGMKAKTSKDNGDSWSDEIILRADGRSQDLGYPRSVQRPDGKIVSIYYYCDPMSDPDRYIAATIWDPSKI